MGVGEWSTPHHPEGFSDSCTTLPSPATHHHKTTYHYQKLGPKLAVIPTCCRLSASRWREFHVPDCRERTKALTVSMYPVEGGREGHDTGVCTTIPTEKPPLRFALFPPMCVSFRLFGLFAIFLTFGWQPGFFAVLPTVKRPFRRSTRKRF